MKTQKLWWTRTMVLSSVCGLIAWQAPAAQDGTLRPKAAEGHDEDPAHQLIGLPSIPDARTQLNPAHPADLSPGPRVGPYRALDDTPRTVTNFNAEAVRPMAITADGLDLYAVNVHGNTVTHHQNAGFDPETVFDVAMNPVSLALHGDDLWVVCQGTESLLQLDRTTGEIVNAVWLRGEPSDIVIDASIDVAYVSLPGTDELAEVDLSTLEIKRHHNPDAKRGRMLFLESDGTVMIAPELSGNNSTTVGGAGNAIVVDLEDPAISPDGLPDEDLFKFDPRNDTFTAVFKGMGSIMLAHGRNPDTGDYWMCNIQSFNKDPLKQSEPAVNGQFALNALTIGDDSGGGLVGPLEIIDLDDWDPVTGGSQIDPNRTISMPQSLVFATTGEAFIAGSNSDRVTMLDSAGDRLTDFIVPDGGIPQGLLLDPTTETLLVVYAWGTNKMYIYNLVTLAPLPFATVDLGGDPTPKSVREGRELFYDASKSMDNRFTCGHCHPRGNTDGLVWNISNSPFDEKGPMVTQPLFGIESISPFHWRGERQLIDFNAAFPGLLGGPGKLDETPGGDFAKFEEFIFSLTTPSSPRESVHRRLNFDPNAEALPSGLVGDPVRGQDVYFDVPSIGAVSCVFCHSAPNGTSGDPINEIGSQLAVRVAQDVTAFSNGTIGLKDQKEVGLTIFGNAVDKPLLGGGVIHAATIDTFFDFNAGLGQLDLQQQADLTEFLLAFDQATAPAAQYVRMLNQTGTAASAARIRGILLRQARKGWLDVAVVGTYPIGGSPTHLRWTFDPDTELFLPEDSNLSPVDFASFVTHAGSGLASNMFIGVPPGNGVRFGIDVDDDGLLNGDEVLHGTTDFNQDFDDDTYPDGYEVAHGSDPTDDLSLPSETTLPQFTKLPELLWMTASSAKVTFETDEPTHWSVEYETIDIDPITVESLDASTVHTVVLHDLFPSTANFKDNDYFGIVTITDLNGNSFSEPLPAEMTTNSAFIGAAPFIAVLNEAQFVQDLRGIGTLDAVVEFRTDFEVGGPPFFAMPNRVVIAELLVNGQNFGSFTSSHSTSFKLDGVTYGALPGPFLISTTSVVDDTAGDGIVQIDFVATGLSPGDEVTVNVIMVPDVDPDSWDPITDPDVPAGGQFLWSMPDTRPDQRSVSLTF